MKFWDLLDPDKDIGMTISDEAKKAVVDVLDESFLGRMIVDDFTDRPAKLKEKESDMGLLRNSDWISKYHNREEAEKFLDTLMKKYDDDSEMLEKIRDARTNVGFYF
ncbi:MAG: hypothetical protein ACYDHG_04310 [Desulfomonilaceae bacterium]